MIYKTEWWYRIKIPNPMHVMVSGPDAACWDLFSEAHPQISLSQITFWLSVLYICSDKMLKHYIQWTWWWGKLSAFNECAPGSMMVNIQLYVRIGWWSMTAPHYSHSTFTLYHTAEILLHIHNRKNANTLGTCTYLWLKCNQWNAWEKMCCFKVTWHCN